MPQVQRRRPAGAPKRGQIWRLDENGVPTPVEVFYGISDGVVTEIVRGDISPGAEIVVGKRSAPDKSPSRVRFGF